MDQSTLIQAGLSASCVALLLAIYRIAKTVVGKRLISDCCGKRLTIGVQIGEMTPVPEPMVENPSHV